MLVSKLLSDNLVNQINKFSPNYLKQDKDFFAACIGYEGDGKSTLALEICLLVDPTFNIDRIVFTPEQFERAFNKAKAGQAILVDEAIEIFGAKTQMKRDQFENLKRVVQGRYKNLFIMFCVPDLYLLEWYISTRRLRAIFRIPLEQRGVVLLYNFTKQRKYFKFIRSNHTVKFPKALLRGTNKALSGELWETYLKKKAGYKQADNKVSKKVRKIREKWDNTRSHYFDTYQTLRALGVSSTTLKKWVKERKIKRFVSPYGKKRVFYRIKDVTKIALKRLKLKAKLPSNTKKRGKYVR